MMWYFSPRILALSFELSLGDRRDKVLLAVATCKQELRAGLEGLWTWNEEFEGVGQPIHRIECEADRKRILDLLPRDNGSQHRAHVVPIHRAFTRQLAQHAQC